MKVIITGATGMVGKSILLQCLASDKVLEVLSIGRRELGLSNPKLKELVHKDFMDFSSVSSEFAGYDACFHCMGVSSIGKGEEEFKKFTFDITRSLANACFSANPNMVMTYVSGAGTDSTEKGSIMWARVKGRTENYILNKGFKDAYMFRLGALIPGKGISSGTGWYKYIYIVISPLFPLLRKLNSVTTSEKIGKAMINAVTVNQELKHLENKDINLLSTK